METIVSLDKCEWDRQRRVLKLASEYMGMPKEFYVASPRTGRVVRFTVVSENDPLFDPDQWDGEQQVYRPDPSEMDTRVDHMVIYNQW